MHCVSCVAISLIGFVSDKCSFVVAFVDGLFIYGYNFLRFDVFRMSTRRLYVILFVFLFSVTVISYLLLRGGRGVFVSFRQTACIYISDFS